MFVHVEFRTDLRRRSFKRLAASFPDIRSVMLDPLDLPDREYREVALSEQADRWLSHNSTPARRILVAAYCTGAAFGLTLATTIQARTDSEVVALVVDPAFVTRPDVDASVAEMLNVFGYHGRLPSDFGSTLAMFNTAERALVESLPNDEPTAFRELVKQYSRWTSYLWACVGAKPAYVDFPVHVLSDDTEPADLTGPAIHYHALPVGEIPRIVGAVLGLTTEGREPTN